MKAFIIRMEDGLHEAFKEMAWRRRVSMNAILNRALEAAIERHWLGVDKAEGKAKEEFRATPLYAVLGPESISSGNYEAPDPQGTMKEVATTETVEMSPDRVHQAIEGIISGSKIARPSKLVSAPRAEEAGVPNCPVCATDMVEVEARGRRSMVCPRCAAG